jgi:hypothetical protein
MEPPIFYYLESTVHDVAVRVGVTPAKTSPSAGYLGPALLENYVISSLQCLSSPRHLRVAAIAHIISHYSCFIAQHLHPARGRRDSCMSRKLLFTTSVVFTISCCFAQALLRHYSGTIQNMLRKDIRNHLNKLVIFYKPAAV